MGPGASDVGGWSRWDRRPEGPSVGPGGLGLPVVGTPVGGPVSYETSGRGAPGAPPTGGGSPFLPRNGGEEGQGGKPLDPRFYSRSFPLAGFWVGCFWIRSRGYFVRYAKTDLGRIF